ncbi:GNAT family N-acetyltransferase [Microbispora sp. ZYX-F-249]|uniref:Lysine N-acyltransferase MbtK n=1 Tax=Microbispora maris TaxID=3144104 RepID=A0ABV0AF10_9ACTN
MSALLFRRHDERVGELAVRRLDPEADAPTVHAWVTHPKAVFWMMRDATVADVAKEYREIVGHPHRDAFLGLVNGRPAFLAESYDPARVELAGLYEARDGDVGMHFLCAPAGTPVHGFTRAVITTVMEFLFADPATRRVVVEPDVRNTAVHALNAAVGFEVAGMVAKPEKDALLSFCTRERFLAATFLAAPGEATA